MTLQQQPREAMALAKFFISGTPVFEQVKDASEWVEVNAWTIAGAKRAAARQAHGVTFSARVAIRTVKGEFETLAVLHNSSAITRRRAVWVAAKRA